MTRINDVLIEITPEVLLKAYACGIFPMAEGANDPGLYWIEPELRGVLPLEGFHMSARLARTVRADRFEIRIDTAFDEVIDACAAPAAGRPKTWINGRIARLYRELHAAGHCHSVEAWSGDALVGGLYGVRLGAAFFGESMFHRERDASKVALVHLAARLRHGGYRLLDTQFVTDHLKRFGAIETPRRDYHRLLEDAIRDEGQFFAWEKGRVVSGAEAIEALNALRGNGSVNTRMVTER